MLCFSVSGVLTVCAFSRPPDFGNKNQQRLENSSNENTNQFMPNNRASNFNSGSGFQNHQQQDSHGDQQESRQNSGGGQHHHNQFNNGFERSNTSSYFNRSSTAAVSSPFKRMMPGHKDTSSSMKFYISIITSSLCFQLSKSNEDPIISLPNRPLLRIETHGNGGGSGNGSYARGFSP